MAYLKNSHCAYNSAYNKCAHNKLSLNETIMTVIIPKKKSLQTLIKSRDRFRVFDKIR